MCKAMAMIMCENNLFQPILHLIGVNEVHTLLLKSSARFCFLKYFFQQGYIKLIKRDRKYINNVEDFHFKNILSFWTFYSSKNT